MIRPAVQLIIFHGSLDSLPEILHRVDEAGFEGVEFAYRLFESDPKKVARTLDQTGLDVVGRHMIPEDIDGRLDEQLEVYRQIGCDRLAITHFDEARFEDERSVAGVARSIEALADRLDDHGFTVEYHNDGAENVQMADGRTALEELLTVLDEDIDFQLDLRHAIKGGLDPVRLLERHANRIETVHFRDAVPDVDHSIALGQGEVDLDGVLGASVQSDVEWLIYEGNHHMDTLEGALEAIQPDRKVE